MKKILICFLCIMVFSGCSNTKTKQELTKNEVFEDETIIRFINEYILVFKDAEYIHKENLTTLFPDLYDDSLFRESFLVESSIYFTYDTFNFDGLTINSVDMFSEHEFRGTQYNDYLSSLKFSIDVDYDDSELAENQIKRILNDVLEDYPKLNKNYSIDILSHVGDLEIEICLNNDLRLKLLSEVTGQSADALRKAEDDEKQAIIEKIKSKAQDKKDLEKNKFRLIELAKFEVEKLLKTPTKAKHAPINEYQIEKNGDTYAITSYVDSQNSFGAMIRTKYKMYIELIDDNGYIVLNTDFE